MCRTFSYTLLITWVLLTISCKTQFVQKSYETNNISISENAAEVDSQLVQLYSPFKRILEKDMQRVISVSDKEMVKDKPESALTNLLADLLMVEGSKNCTDLGFSFIPDFAIQNYGSIRVPLPKGEITVGNIFELMPFENELVYVKLSGKQVARLISFLIEEEESCISGIRLKIKDKTATEIKIGGKPLVLGNFYWIATSEFVAEGGDDFIIFKEKLDIKQSGIKIRDAIISYLEERQQKGELISVIPDGRIYYE